MEGLKIGIVSEGRIPVDRRVPLLPAQCVEIQNKYKVEIIIQPSDIRCIANKEYLNVGLKLSEDLSDCDIILGIKEIPIHLLIPSKTYLFFSHTIKMQPHNQKLLQTILGKKITLIDYECLKDEMGNRIIAFGRFAGIVGAYNGLMIYGKKYKLFDLKRAFQCYDLEDVKRQLNTIKLPNIRIAVTGSGRVAKGTMEILDFLNIPKVDAEKFCAPGQNQPAYIHLNSLSYHSRIDAQAPTNVDFYAYPEKYKSVFAQYAQCTDLLIAAAYWNPNAPMLFSKDDMKSDNFKIKVIADITCDVGGSIPSNIKASTIYDPAYDYNPQLEVLEAPFSDGRNITVMAIDNLPGELPRDASKDFGVQLMQNVLPSLLSSNYSPIIENGTIATNGRLGPLFQYLESFAR